jgi:hypothetical protein
MDIKVSIQDVCKELGLNDKNVLDRAADEVIVHSDVIINNASYYWMSEFKKKHNTELADWAIEQLKNHNDFFYGEMCDVADDHLCNGQDMMIGWMKDSFTKYFETGEIDGNISNIDNIEQFKSLRDLEAAGIDMLELCEQFVAYEVDTSELVYLEIIICAKSIYDDAQSDLDAEIEMAKIHLEEYMYEQGMDLPEETLMTYARKIILEKIDSDDPVLLASLLLQGEAV